MPNIPDIDAVETKLSVASEYTARGWPVFVLGREKTPLPNCWRCNAQRLSYVPHDRETCECLTCHGFYAATLDLGKIRTILERHSDGMLALRTGGRNGEGGGLLVIDAEASADPRAQDGITGLDVIDDWEGWTGHSLTATLRQRTGSGGLHLTYRIPPGMVVGCHNRILPQVDLKATGGYVAVWSGGGSCDDGRIWLDPLDHVAEVPTAVLEWIDSRRGRAGAHGVGRDSRLGGGQLLGREDFERCLRDGASSGEREPFFAMLIFTLFKRGHERWQVEQEVREHWERCEQPPSDEFPWQAIEYKLNRDEHNVIRDQPLDERLRQWAESKIQAETLGERNITESEPDTYKVGNVTLARRKR